MMDQNGDIHAGHYSATGTVHSTRRNLFNMEPGKERHIGTLVGSSKTKIQQFEEDCDRIVRALALLDAVEVAERWIHEFVDGTDALETCLAELEPTRQAIPKAEGRSDAPDAVDWREWAKSLTPQQLTAALNEMRDRGAAVAYYDADALATMYDGDEDMADANFDAFMAEERDELEETMCDAARKYVESNI